MLYQLAHKIRAQIHHFSGKLSYGLSKPQSRFVEEMLYGLNAGQCVMLSSISRTLNESIKLIKTENRLCRNLGNGFLHLHLQRALARHLGYHEDALVPLYGHLYSAKAPDFRSENHELFKAIDMVRHAAQGKGIWVMDRGGDRNQLYDYLLGHHQRFILRLTQKRHLLAGTKSSRKADMLTLAHEMKLPYTQDFIRSKEGATWSTTLRYGARKVRLPEHPDQVLTMVVVRGFGEKPLVLLTNVQASPLKIMQNYLARWKVEETIRFMKQTYDLENVRLLTYQRLQNLFALVMGAVAFGMSYLSLQLKLQAMFTKVIQAGKALFETPDFHYYVLAQGLRNVFQRHPKPLYKPIHPPNPHQLSLF